MVGVVCCHCNCYYLSCDSLLYFVHRLLYNEPTPPQKIKSKQTIKNQCKENNTKKANKRINGIEFLLLASETRRQVDET
jgi:hypothetical protein